VNGRENGFETETWSDCWNVAYQRENDFVNEKMRLTMMMMTSSVQYRKAPFFVL
jgi:hypothetical protein